MGGLPTSTVNGFAVHPTDPKVMYVAMRDRILRSDDAGLRWTAAADGPKNVAAVAVNPKTGSEVYAVTVDGAVYVSQDGGVRWELRQ